MDVIDITPLHMYAVSPRVFSLILRLLPLCYSPFRVLWTLLVKSVFLSILPRNCDLTPISLIALQTCPPSPPSTVFFY